MKHDQTKPEVGMGVTRGVGSDCYPFTIVEIISSNRILVQQDNAVADVANGHDYFSNQKWIIYPNIGSPKVLLSYRKKSNCWTEVGQSPKYNRYFIGDRFFYQDPCF